MARAGLSFGARPGGQGRDPRAAHAAVFYSISSTQRGLAGVDLGNFLIKQARPHAAPHVVPRPPQPCTAQHERARAALPDGPAQHSRSHAKQVHRCDAPCTQALHGAAWALAGCAARAAAAHRCAHSPHRRRRSLPAPNARHAYYRYGPSACATRRAGRAQAAGRVPGAAAAGHAVAPARLPRLAGGAAAPPGPCGAAAAPARPAPRTVIDC